MEGLFMRKTIKGYIAGALSMFFLLGGTMLFASPVMREIHYGVNVIVNGRPLQLEGIDRPFIMDGRTFLPVSVIAQELGIQTTWDGATRTVSVGGGTAGSPLFETTPTAASNGITTVSGTMSDRSFNTILRTPANLMSGVTSTGWGEFNLNGQFSSISGVLGRLNNGAATSNIVFIGDGTEIARFAVDGTTVAHDISVDVRGVVVLRIEILQNLPAGLGTTRAQVGFADPMLH